MMVYINGDDHQWSEFRLQLNGVTKCHLSLDDDAGLMDNANGMCSFMEVLSAGGAGCGGVCVVS